ncbi:hypothetical protein ACLB2K_001518 [Fragaria x ananassa]
MHEMSCNSVNSVTYIIDYHPNSSSINCSVKAPGRLVKPSQKEPNSGLTKPNRVHLLLSLFSRTSSAFSGAAATTPLFSTALSRIGLAVMGKNLALNIAEKGSPIAVYNRTSSKVDEIVHRAATEGDLPLSSQYTPKDFILSLQRP